MAVMASSKLDFEAQILAALGIDNRADEILSFSLHFGAYSLPMLTMCRLLHNREVEDVAAIVKQSGARPEFHAPPIVADEPITLPNSPPPRPIG